MPIRYNWPEFIAEISANHCGKIEIAKKLIKCAKINGADAVKLQTYTADSMTIKSNKPYFKIKKGLWKNYSLWELYNKASTPYKWHKELFAYAKKINIKIFSTPFDEKAVDFLEELNCPIYKVASFEMQDHGLIRRICKTKKPIIISTGMSNLKEIEATYNVAKENGAKNICLLYCVSNYPSKVEDFNLNNIKILKKKFNCEIGFSDHSNDFRIAILAKNIGARVFEKHIALQNQKCGFDIKFSLKGKEIRQFKDNLISTDRLMGTTKFSRSNAEMGNKIFRRSIFSVKKINKGDFFTLENIRKIRPGYGLSPEFYEKIIGKKSKLNISAGSPILSKHFK